MNHRFFAVFLALFLAMNLAACSAAGAAAMPESPEMLLRREAIPGPTEPDSTVTQTQAENIALQYAGFTAQQVTSLKTAYEVDNGIPQYDVEFHVDDWEYEFEISAKDGQILSFDRDHKYD